MRIVDVARHAKIASVPRRAGSNIEFCAQLRSPLVVGNDNTRLNQHLPNRDIQLSNQSAHLIKLGWGIVDEKRIGARI